MSAMKTEFLGWVAQDCANDLLLDTLLLRDYVSVKDRSWRFWTINGECSGLFQYSQCIYKSAVKDHFPVGLETQVIQ